MGEFQDQIAAGGPFHRYRDFFRRERDRAIRFEPSLILEADHDAAIAALSGRGYADVQSVNMVDILGCPMRSRAIFYGSLDHQRGCFAFVMPPDEAFGVVTQNLASMKDRQQGRHVGITPEWMMYLGRSTWYRGTVGILTANPTKRLLDPRTDF